MFRLCASYPTAVYTSRALVFNAPMQSTRTFFRTGVGAAAIGLALTVALAGCSSVESGPQSSSAAPPAVMELCDGTEVSFDRPVEKIATGNTAALELLIRLGAADKVVGTAWSDGAGALSADVRTQAEKVPSLGARAADKEKLLQSGAQVYIDPYEGMTMMGITGPTAADFQAAGMKRVVLRSSACTASLTAPVTTLDGVMADIRSLAALVGRQQEGEKLVESMRTEPVAADAIRPKVLYLTSARNNDQASTIGNRQIGNAIIELAGGTNIFRAVDKAQFASSWEDVVAGDPDVIVVAVTRQSSRDAVDRSYQALLDQLKSDPRIAGLRAVREGRFVRAYAEDFTLPGVENATVIRSLSQELSKLR